MEVSSWEIPLQAEVCRWEIHLEMGQISSIAMVECPNVIVDVQ